MKEIKKIAITVEITIILLAILVSVAEASTLNCTSDSDIQGRQTLLSKSLSSVNKQQQEVDRLQSYGYTGDVMESAIDKLHQFQDDLAQDRELLDQCEAQVDAYNNPEPTPIPEPEEETPVINPVVAPSVLIQAPILPVQQLITPTPVVAPIVMSTAVKMQLIKPVTPEPEVTRVTIPAQYITKAPMPVPPPHQNWFKRTWLKIKSWFK